MNSKLKNDSTDFLFDAILSLKTKEDCYRFFEDLCTKPELNAMSQRIVVAKMLTEKTVYSEIVTKLNPLYEEKPDYFATMSKLMNAGICGQKPAPAPTKEV